jgi:hypothetical protein
VEAEIRLLLLGVMDWVRTSRGSGGQDGR